MEYFDLGSFARPVTTSSETAQLWFNRGLIWMYGVNHEEAIRCFKNAVADDPGCVMAHWGMAHAIGPNYNKVWGFFTPDEQVAALTLAHAAIAAAQSHPATPVERALIAALADRFPTERMTLGAAKGFDSAEFVAELRLACVTPHVAQKSRYSAIDGRKGSAFGFVSSHRDRKSSKPGEEGDDRAKRFALCSRSSGPDFQTR